MLNSKKFMMSSASGAGGWINVLGATNVDTDAGFNVAIDTDNGYYHYPFSANPSSGGGKVAHIATLDSAGDLVRLLSAGRSGQTNRFRGAYYHSTTGDVLGVGHGANDNNYTQCIYSAFDASTGTATFHRAAGENTNGQPDYGYGQTLAADSNGNVYVGHSKNNGADGASWHKLLGSNLSVVSNSSYQIYSSSGFQQFSMAINSSNKIYNFGYTIGQYKAVVTKSDLDATNLSKKLLVSPASGKNVFFLNGHIDSSDNVYATGYGDDTATEGTGAIICKYDSNLNVTWKKKLQQVSNSTCYGFSIDADDSTGDVYVCGYGESGPTKGFVAKYNSSGTLQWLNRLGAVSGNNNTQFWGISLDSANGLLLINGSTRAEGASATANESQFCGAFPADGSGTGVYGNLLYESLTTGYRDATALYTESTNFSTSTGADGITIPTVTQTNSPATLTEEKFDF